MFHVVVIFSVAAGLESGFSRLGWTPIPDFACGVHLASILVSPSMPANEERSPHQMSLLDCSSFKSDIFSEFSASCTIFGEIQRSHSPTDDGRDRARFLCNKFDKRALTSFE